MPNMLPYQKEYTQADAIEAARQYRHLTPYLHRIEYVLKTFARVNGPFAFVEETANDEPASGIYVDERATLYQQVPNWELVAGWYVDNKDTLGLAKLLQTLFEKGRTDHMMSWLRQQPEYPDIARYLDGYGDGAWMTVAGEPTLGIRQSPPDAMNELKGADNDTL